MRTLIATDSPLYHRRMRGAIGENMQHGVYLAGPEGGENSRVCAAKLVKGILRVKLQQGGAEPFWHAVEGRECDEVGAGTIYRITRNGVCIRWDDKCPYHLIIWQAAKSLSLERGK